MAIPIPTVDQFKDTTVMRCMRKVVNYLIEDVVPAINQSPSQDTKVSGVENNISTDSKLTTTVTNSDGSTATSNPVQLPESGGVELNITQTPDGITINNIQLQEATNAQDGLVTKEQVKAIEDNTAMGDALSKELINGIVLAEGATPGTIKATLEQEDGTTIVSNDLPLPSSGVSDIIDVIIPSSTFEVSVVSVGYSGGGSTVRTYYYLEPNKNPTIKNVSSSSGNIAIKGAEISGISDYNTGATYDFLNDRSEIISKALNYITINTDKSFSFEFYIYPVCCYAVGNEFTSKVASLYHRKSSKGMKVTATVENGVITNAVTDPTSVNCFSILTSDITITSSNYNKITYVLTFNLVL